MYEHNESNNYSIVFKSWAYYQTHLDHSKNTIYLYFVWIVYDHFYDDEYDDDDDTTMMLINNRYMM